MFCKIIAVACLGTFLAVAEADDKPPLTINEIMVRAHLKPQNRMTRNNLDSKVIDSKATREQQQELLDLYTQLSKAKPPKGDPEAWAKRTAEMVDSVKAVIAGEKGAAERLTRVRDCKACHDAHRSED